MNIHTVAENLRNTIAGKEQMLKDTKFNMAFGDGSWQSDIGKQMALHATIEFLEINIDELKRILQDVEVCAKQASDDSWITNPDRMGGGGWTADELDPNRGWK
jgi:hypothetical protein